MADILEVRALRKVFTVPAETGGTEQLVAVDGVDFGLTSTGSLALVGESGSGKTTVARIIAGLEPLTSGHVTVCGEHRSRRPRRAERTRFARYVQMVFQDPYSSLDPRQTIAGSLEEALRAHFQLGGEQRRRRLRELLDQVGLDQRQAHARPAELSGGQRQRAAIARALAVEPRLLILDEAVSALDVSVQAQIVNLLIDLRASLDVAFLFISHDLAVVRQVSETCLVMQGGQIVERGPVATVLDHPSHVYTQQLIDAIPRPGWQPRRRASHAATAVT
jgi:oligopeptide transport system ATP-binding protein